MNRKVLGILAVGFLFVLSRANDASAQTVSRELPEGPLLRPAPEFSQWSVDFSYPQDRKDPKAGALAPLDPQLSRKIVTTKTRDILREEIKTVGGTATDNWQQNGSYYRKLPGNPYWSAYEKPTQLQIESGAAVIMTVPDSGFRGLDWVGRETYVGSVEAEGMTYLIFVPAESRTVDLSNTKLLQELPTIAFVDAKSRLPVRVKDKDVLRTYKFLTPPGAMQVVPADLAAEIKKGDEIKAKFNAAPSREY
jgi:hypothetical protein